MAVEQVKVPSPGESVTEGRIAQWYKPDGAAVQVDEPLFELESDKAAQTVPAPVAGVLRIKVKEGEIVPVGAVVAEIDPAGVPQASGGRKPPEATPAAATPTATPATPSALAGSAQGANAPRSGEPVASPAAQRVLDESGLDPSQVPGTGPRGIVTKEDAVRQAGVGDRVSGVNGPA
ncbi:MAG TPA: biotin/lipoyl-containing protein, partial [Fimbriiglobus sp.]|nr:biotin/lipoyl-containing protein [Fimbriiglobus sp.]